MHTDLANRDTLIGINIESKNALDNIESILQIDELDMVFIGLYDLSKSLGIPGQINHDLVQNKLTEVVNKINDSGKYSGTIATDKASLKKYKDIGVKYILYLVDCMILENGFSIPVEELKALS